MLTSFIHIINSLCSNNYEMIKLLFGNHLDIMIIIIALVSLSLIFQSVGCRFGIVIYPPGICGLILYFVYFYIEKSNNDPNINPFGVLVNCLAIPLTIFVNVFFFKQYGLISKGLTTKQLASILKEVKIGSSSSNDQSDEYNTMKRKIYGTLSFNEKMTNLKTFLTKSITKSLFD